MEIRYGIIAAHATPHFHPGHTHCFHLLLPSPSGLRSGLLLGLAVGVHEDGDSDVHEDEEGKHDPAVEKDLASESEGAWDVE
jgi:hypothetical protein